MHALRQRAPSKTQTREVGNDMSDATLAAAAAGETTCGRRPLGFWMCTALVIGNTIGMGIFLQPASLAPFGYNALIAWAITICGAVLLALIFASLARRMAQADSPYEYVRATQGDGVAFLAMWCYWVSVWVTNAALAVGVVGYLAAVIPPLGSFPPVIVAVALIWLFVIVNLLGVRTGGGVQVVTTAIKLVPMAVIIGLGLWTLIADPVAYTRNPPSTPLAMSGSTGVLAASAIVLYAMLGIESAAVPAGQVHDPERTIPRATLAGTLIVALAYIGVTVIALLIVPQAILSASSAPFVEVLDRLSGVGGGRWLALFVVVSGLGCLNGWTMLVGDLTRTLAARGFVPEPLVRCNRYGAPAAALIVTAVLASVLALMNYSKTLVEGFTFLTIVITAANLPLYLCCALALVVIWRRAGGAVSSSLLWLGLGGAAYTVFVFFGVGLKPFLLALLLAACGLPFYAWWRVRGRAAVAPATVPAIGIDR
jgi:APA family basic amino acid/polyamine antiporter